MYHIVSDRKDTNVTCSDQLLDMFKQKKRISTDEIIRRGVIDYRSAKRNLKLKGHNIGTEKEKRDKTKGKYKKGTRLKTFYIYYTQVPECHRKIEKRDYLRKFSNEEIISELWARNMLSGKLVDDKILHFINE